MYLLTQVQFELKIHMPVFWQFDGYTNILNGYIYLKGFINRTHGQRCLTKIFEFLIKVVDRYIFTLGSRFSVDPCFGKMIFSYSPIFISLQTIHMQLGLKCRLLEWCRLCDFCWKENNYLYWKPAPNHSLLFIFHLIVIIYYQFCLLVHIYFSTDQWLTFSLTSLLRSWDCDFCWRHILALKIISVNIEAQYGGHPRWFKLNIYLEIWLKSCCIIFHPLLSMYIEIIYIICHE